MLVPGAFASPATGQTSAAADEKPATQVLVRFHADADAGERREARRDADADFVEPLPLSGLQVVDPEPGVAVDEAVAALERSPDVLYAEPDALRTTAATPNDQFFNLQWGLRNTGQLVRGTTGAPGADIDATSAWNIATGNTGVAVGVLDSGVDVSHPDLNSNIRRNPGETGGGRETNRLDDDGNGFRDDVTGWDWVQDDNSPNDGDGHGTHVAGTIGARGNDGTGVTGVAWQAGLVPLRVLDDNGSGSVSDLIQGYAYAQRNGIRIVNASLGGSGSSQSERAALVAAPNVLFVVAAGNDGVDNDTTGSFPCNYDLANVVCVAASDSFDALPGFSNYGAGTVDLAAPGVNVLSTSPGNRTAWMSGTSMATPHVAGVAALVRSLRPSASVAAIRATLLGSVDVMPSLRGCVATGGRLNAYRALSGAAQIPPPPRGPAACLTRTPAGPVAMPSPAPTPLPAVRPDPATDPEPSEPVAGAADHRPRSVARRTGRFVRGRGALARLFKDDGRRLEVAARRRSKRRFVSELRAFVRLTTAQRDGLTRLGLTYDGGASRRGVTMRVRIYDWADGRWRTVARLRNATRDRTVRWSTTRDPARFASSRGTVRVSILATAKRPFRSRSDLLRISTR